MVATRGTSDHSSGGTRSIEAFNGCWEDSTPVLYSFPDVSASSSDLLSKFILSPGFALDPAGVPVAAMDAALDFLPSQAFPGREGLF